ncbi:MAG TPA: HD domain-containing protein [Thermodesulfobacteriota bacterium]|nr:HD domain-containing protein [Thermodesulfobacteriota bacterium]
MISKGIIDRLFDAASIQRWNDHVRPVKFTELDKQAHKMIIAYVLARSEESDKGVKIHWKELIEGGIFELLQRVVLTDIKPPVFHRMMEKKGRELNEKVLETLEADLESLSGDFLDKFEKYLLEKDYSAIEKKILKAAHFLATNWEFRIIYHVSSFIYGIEKTKEALENQIEDHYDLIGVQKISSGKKSFGFIDLCGQLRFQQRWAHSARIPETSVLGHLLIVAVLSYFCSVEFRATPKRIYNNFFAGLFHDLPEALTRDIIAPVKRSVTGLDQIIKDYEKVQVEEKLLPLLPSSWHEELVYFIEDEFENKIIIDGAVKKGISCEEISKKYNHDRFSPVDGHIIEACDQLAAFREATLSIEQGIESKSLKKAKRDLYESYKRKKVGGVNFGQIFDYFNGK